MIEKYTVTPFGILWVGMRPLFHPSIEDITVEGILHALSDPVRARIYLSLAETGDPQICSSFLTVSEKTIPKSTLSQHFKILREAGLVRSERQGVEVYNTSRCGEIDTKFPGLLSALRKAYAMQCAATGGGVSPSVSENMLE